MRRRDRRLRRGRRVTLLGRLARLRDEEARGVLFTVVEGDGVGAKALVIEGAETCSGTFDSPAPGSRFFSKLYLTRLMSPMSVSSSTSPIRFGSREGS